MPSTQYKGFTVPTTGSEPGTWGTDINTNFTALVDTMLGGQQTIPFSSFTSGALTLSTAQSQYALTTFTGTLTQNVTVTTPCLGYFAVENLFTGNYSLTIQYTGGVGKSVIVPQYAVRDYICDATNGIRARNLDPPGTVKYLAAGVAALHPSLTGEYVLAYGQTLTQSAYPNLYVIYGGTGGTFVMPDLRGRSVFGLDNMGGSAAGRITVAGSGIDGTVYGNTGGAQSTALVVANIPAHSHGVTVTDPGHSHSITTTTGNTTGGTSGSSGGTVQPTNTGSSVTGISATTATVGSGTAFGTMNPAFLCNVMIKT